MPINMLVLRVCTAIFPFFVSARFEYDVAPGDQLVLADDMFCHWVTEIGKVPLCAGYFDYSP